MVARSIRKLPLAIVAFGLLLALNASSALAAPVVTTGVTTEAAQTYATLNGTVAAEFNSGPRLTRYDFGYGTTPNMSEFTGATPVETTESEIPKAVSAHITGLAAGTTYYYVIAARDTVTNEYAFGKVRSFTTQTLTGMGFMAATYPATINGTFGKERVFEAAEGKVQVDCKTRKLTGTLPKAENSLSIVPKFESCTSSGLGGPVTVKMNSCSWVFNVTDNFGVYGGDLVVSCSKEGDTIEYLGTATGCGIKLAPQTPLASDPNYQNTGPITARQISMGGWANAMKWTVSNKFICTTLGGLPEAGSDGSFGNGLAPPGQGLDGSSLSATHSGAYDELYVGG
jgi:hypothetical protein